MNRIEERRIVSAMVKQMQEEFAKGDRKGIYAMIQKKMAYNSNKIEGSTLTSEQTASLFDTGTLYAAQDTMYRTKDVEEMNGHFLMFNYMLKTLDEPLSEELIKAFHYNLKVGVFEDRANGYPIGEYKNRTNQVSDITTARPKDVPERIHDLVEKYAGVEFDIRMLASFHAEFEKIHPFQDGNGRTGRMLLLRQCLKAQMIPVLIQDSDKMAYYHNLHVAQAEGNMDGLESFFEKMQNVFLEYAQDFISEEAEALEIGMNM